jgi:hypothetical protein
VSGRFTSSTLDFDPGVGTASLSTKGADRFLAKYDGAGNFLWARRIGGTGDEGWGTDVKVDGIGNVYISDGFIGLGDITGVDSVNRTEYQVTPPNSLESSFTMVAGKHNTITKTYTEDCLVVKFDANGNIVPGWVKQFGGAGATTSSYGLAVLPDGSAVYVTGSFSGTVDFDPGPGVTRRSSAGGTDAYVEKLTADGSLSWVNSFGSTGDEIGYSIALAADGGAYVVGSFTATVAFGGTSLTSSGGIDAFVAKLTPTGTFNWARRMGGAADDRGEGVGVYQATPGTDSVYITGSFAGTKRNQVADFGTASIDGAGAQTLTAHGTYNDAFVSKLSGAGNFLWTRQLGGTGGIGAYGLAVDAAGGVYTTGQSGGTIDFDPGPAQFLLTGPPNIFVSKLDDGGNFAWATLVGPAGASGGLGYALACDPVSRAVFVAARDPIVNSTSDGIVAKFDQAGGGASAASNTNSQGIADPPAASPLATGIANGDEPLIPRSRTRTSLDVLDQLQLIHAEDSGQQLGFGNEVGRPVQIDPIPAAVPNAWLALGLSKRHRPGLGLTS